MPFLRKNNSQGGQAPEGLVAEAEKEGKKLGTLIAAFPMPDETRQALLELLPNFSLEQLARLSAILETAYLNQKTGSADKEFIEVLKNIDAEHKKKMGDLDNKTLKALDELDKNLEKGGK